MIRSSLCDGSCATIEKMSRLLTDGPRPPESVAGPHGRPANRLVPFVHVEDVERPMAFYCHLGFTVESVYKDKGRPAWAALRSEEPRPSQMRPPFSSPGQRENRQYVRILVVPGPGRNQP